MKLLLIEDDKELARTLKELLEEEGFVVSLALDGKRGLDKALTEEYELILIDYFLPSLTGLEVLKRIRQEGIKTPVIMLTVVDDTDRKVDCLSLGADDYITKPFHFKELLARIYAVLRRYKGLESSKIEVDGVLLDLESSKVFCEGKPVELTAGELRLLRYLFLNRGRFVSREELLEKALQSLEASGNVVEVLISRLRKKLGKDIIRSQKGLGYRVG
jgi:two-component system OmpR family response regulator